MGIQTGKINILSILHEWFQLLESGHDISAFFLRLQEAFDSLACSAIVLIDKLCRIGFHLKLLQYMVDRL